MYVWQWVLPKQKHNEAHTVGYATASKWDFVVASFVTGNEYGLVATGEPTASTDDGTAPVDSIDATGTDDLSDDGTALVDSTKIDDGTETERVVGDVPEASTAIAPEASTAIALEASTAIVLLERADEAADKNQRSSV